MFKKLLSIFAVAVVALAARAGETKVLWESEEGFDCGAWQACYVMTADEAQAQIVAGDFLKMTITAVGESGWPQVALNKAEGGWPPYTSQGVGGQTYPYVASFPVTNELAEQIYANGLMFTGESATVTKIELEKGEPIGPFTVWFGEKKCNWGDPVSVPATVFAAPKAGDLLYVWTSEASCQIILGGWPGLNLPVYGAGGIENMTYEDGVATVEFIKEYAEDADYDGETKNVFELLKANGVVIQGPTTITRVDYFPWGRVLEVYDQDVEAVNELAQAMQQFVDGVSESFPGYLVLKADEIAALNATIRDLNEKMNAALEAAAETCEYEGLTGAEITAANEAFIGLVADCEETLAKIQEEMEADQEAINQLANDFQAFSTQVAEEFPGYAVLKAEEIAALTATVEGLNDKVTKAMETAYETGVYEGLTGEEVTAANEALIALVAGEEEVLKAITDEYEADVENVNALATALQEFNTEIEENFPGFGVLKAEELTALTATVEALNKKVVAALEAAYATGVYEGLTGAEVTEANETLIGLVAEEEEVIKAITDENEEDVAAVNELATALQDFNTEVAETFPGYAVLKAEEIAALTATVEGLNDKVTKAMETAYETGVYEGLTGAEITEANETLIGLVAGLEETVKLITDENEEDVAAVNELATALQGFYAMIEEKEFPGYLNLKADEIAALTAKIEEMNKKVVAGMEAAYETGVYEGLTGAEITEANEALIALVAGIEEAIAAGDAVIEEYSEHYVELNDYYISFNGEDFMNGEFPAFLELESTLETLDVAYEGLETIYNKLIDAIEVFYNETGVIDVDLLPTEADYTLVRETLMGLAADGQELYTAISNAYEADETTLYELADQAWEYMDKSEEGSPCYEGAIAVYDLIMDEWGRQIMLAYAKALVETAEYVSPLNSDVITDLQNQINALQNLSTGIKGIANDNADARYFDLNGQAVKEPVAGKVYIKVVNGKSTKVLVK